jgi:hypothetical protein
MSTFCGALPVTPVRLQRKAAVNLTVWRHPVARRATIGQPPPAEWHMEVSPYI